MKSEEFSKSILALDPTIRFAGLIERSGHLFAGGMRGGADTQLKSKDSDLSFLQSAHIIFLRERFSEELGPLKYILYDYDKVTMYIESVQQELELHPPSNIINKEKRETLRNLYESGIPEEMIADQLDLDMNTVRIIVEEISPK